MGESKSLRQMAQESASKEVTERRAGIGLQCPTCHCRDSYVRKTWHNIDGTETTRRRICRHCGFKFPTIEIVP